MSASVQSRNDVGSGDEVRLLISMHGQDEGAARSAAEQLIKYYAAEGRHGALLKLCEGGKLGLELKMQADLAIVGSIPLHEEPIPGRVPRKYGILNDLAFDRKRPDEVRIAAGKKVVNRLLERLKRGDAGAKEEIVALAKHKYHKEVKAYAKNALDALEAAKEKDKGAFTKKRGKSPPQGQPNAAPAAQGKFRGGFVP